MFPAPLCPRRPSVDQTTPLLSSTNFCLVEDEVQLGTPGRRLASSASSSSTVIRGGLADRRSHPESGGCNLTPPIHRGQRRPVGCAMSGLRFVRGGVPRGAAGRSQPTPGLRKLGRTTNCAARTGTSTCWPTQPGLRIRTTRRNRDDPRLRPRLALQRLRRRRCRHHCHCRRTAPAARHPIRLQAARPPSAALCTGGRTPRSSSSPRTWSKKATPPSQQDMQPSRHQRSLKGTRSQDAAPPIRAARAFEPETLTSAVAASRATTGVRHTASRQAPPVLLPDLPVRVRCASHGRISRSHVFGVRIRSAASASVRAPLGSVLQAGWSCGSAVRNVRTRLRSEPMNVSRSVNGSAIHAKSATAS